jgi:hypothetical protein
MSLIQRNGEIVMGVMRQIMNCLKIGRTLKTPLASVHELSVHVHERCAGTVHVHVRFVPETSCCTASSSTWLAAFSKINPLAVDLYA